MLTWTTVLAGNSAPLDGTFRWSATPPIVLQPGTTYVIGAYASIGNPDSPLGLGENVVFDSRVSLVEGRVALIGPLQYPAAPAPVELTANFKATGPNRPPVANAGPDRNAYTGQTLTLLGSATDPDGHAINTWTWEMDQAPAGASWALAPFDSQFPEFTGFAPGDYVILLVVTDVFEFGSAPDYVTIRVRDNIPPTAVATADRTTIRVGETVCFDGSQSSDPEGGPLRYIWDFADGSPPLDVISPCHSYSSVGTYDALMQVIDERNATDIDTVDITVLPPAAVPALPRSGLVVLGVLLAFAGAVRVSRRVEGKA